MRKKTPEAEEALYVRLPAAAMEKLNRVAEERGMRKKDLVAGLLESLGGQRDVQTARGTYSFRAYEDPPEVMNPAQAAQFLQLDESFVVEQAEAGKIPGRKIGKEWRFARAALVAWLVP